LIHLATAEPVWGRLAIPLLGVALLAVIATGRQRRPTLAVSLVVLTTLLGLWLFGAGLVWSKRGSSMIRGHYEWASNPGAWQWSGLLALAYISVLAVAISLRSFSDGRPRVGSILAFVALVLFASWTAVVRYSIVLAAVTAAVAFAALLADPILSPSIAAASDRARPSGRGLVIAAATVLIAFWLIIALLWLLLRQGENVDCNCWADNHDAWQYIGQFFLSLAGSGFVVVAVVSYLRRKPAALASGASAAMIALGGWVAFWASA
jgi:hypothetical protein